MKRITTTLIGLLEVFIAVGLILPALAKLHEAGSMTGKVVGLYTLGVLLAIVGISTAVSGLRRRDAAQPRA